MIRPADAPWPARTDLEFAALPSAVSCARVQVRAVVMEWGLPHLADTAELLVSELMTNAITASAQLDIAGSPVVGLWIVSDYTCVVIHVWDGSDDKPQRKSADSGDESGRGLAIVEALSTDWGTYMKPRGKVVWARVDG